MKVTVLDLSWLGLQYGESCSNMVGVIPDLDVQTGSLTHKLGVVRLKSEGVLKALGGLSEVLLLLVDAATGVPAEHAFHAALHQRGLCHL